MVHAAVSRWSSAGALGFFAQQPQSRSTSVTAITVRPGVDPEAIRTLARERFQVAIAGGLGPLQGRVFRIGHLGDMNAPMILGCLAGVEAALRVQGVPCGGGALDAATEDGKVAEVRGEFTWRGTSMPLSLFALRFGCRNDARGEVCGGDFEGEFLRGEFGATFGLPLVSNRVGLRVQVEAVRQ